MNLKVVALIFLIVFAATATLCLAAGISSSQMINKDASHTESRSIIQVDEDLVEPQKEIDTPGMPT
ncbi:MAG: hypothetical protein QXU45_09580 [Candidatus Bathyarchaeia archaeon]